MPITSFPGVTEEHCPAVAAHASGATIACAPRLVPMFRWNPEHGIHNNRHGKFFLAGGMAVCLCLAMLLFLSGSGKPLGLGAQPRDITAAFSYTRQPQNTVDPSLVLAGEQKLPFQPLSPPVNIASGDAVSWLRATLEGDAVAPRVLELPSLLVSHIKIWYRLEDGTIVSQASGLAVPIAERTVRQGAPAFIVPDGGGGEIEVLLGIATNSPYNFAALLWDRESWLVHSHHTLAWYGVLIGGLLVLVLYNSFFALSLREPVYLYYVGYEIFMLLTILAYSGLSKEYLPWIKPKPDIVFISALGALFGVLFVNRFLNTANRYPRLRMIFQLNAIYGVLLGLSFYTGVSIAPPGREGLVLHVSLSLSAAYYVLASIHSYYCGVKQARFLALAMLVLVGAMVLHFLYLYARLEYNALLFHVLEAGILAEGILMSLALSDKIKILADEKRRLGEKYARAQRAFTLNLIEIEEAEKKRHASILHDSVGHGLLVLNQRLEKMRQKAPSDDLAAELDSMSEYCHEVMNEVRSLSHELYPHMLEKLGLQAALHSVLERTFAPADIFLVADIDETLPPLPPDLQMALYRIVQESLANILKHAGATEVFFSLRWHEGDILLEIKDDGTGFDVHAEPEGLGLKMMNGHVQLFSGKMEIVSRSGMGTVLRVRAPVPCQILPS